MKTTAIVVDTPEVAKALNEILPKWSRAYAVGQYKAGAGYERIIVTATMARDDFSEWFNYFTLSLRPDGEIIYD